MNFTGGGERVTVSKLQVGLLGSARQLQRDLDRIAGRADTNTPSGLHYVLQGASQIHKAKRASWKPKEGSLNTSLFPGFCKYLFLPSPLEPTSIRFSISFPYYMSQLTSLGLFLL